MKRWIVILISVCMLLTGCGFGDSPETVEKDIFGDLSVENIESIELDADLVNKAIQLSHEQIKQCISILHKVGNVNKVSSEILVGQMIRCTITRKDGSSTEIKIMSPNIIVDGVWYETNDNDEACEQFSQFANEALDSVFK